MSLMRVYLTKTTKKTSVFIAHFGHCVILGSFFNDDLSLLVLLNIVVLIVLI